jgi:hypothetical protein
MLSPLYIVNANCPTYPTLLPTRMFPPDGYCFHVSLNKRGISSQLALEFSIRTARSIGHYIRFAMLLWIVLATRLCKLLRPNGFLLSGSPRSSTSKTRFGLMLDNSQAWFPHSARLCGHNLRVNYLRTLLFYLCRCDAILKVLYFRQSAQALCPTLLTTYA